MSNLYNAAYNPDVLECLANLSNDEVFTPPEIANQMLDLLPQEIFRDPSKKFLDPACKSGVILRELAKRLIIGLEEVFPDMNERINHIYQNQLYGIAITELTSLMSRRSLYYTKYPQTKFSISKFNNPEGNIVLNNSEHTWNDGKCIYCGASKDSYNREEFLETHAYEFIHTLKPKEILNMKFDVIISNPPYQLETGGSGRQAKPIYNLFIEQAKKLNPKYLVMIIPSRWFSGGFGLNQFRDTMLNDDRIRIIRDFPNSKDVFNGVDIAGGVCYFLWNRDNRGDCEFSNVIDGKESKEVRKLNEFNTFVRYNQAVPIIRKVFEVENPVKTLEDVVSPQKPFGLPTNYKPKESGVPCWFIQRIGKKFVDPNDVIDSGNYLNKWKLLLPKAPIAGQTDFSKPVGFYYEGNTLVAAPGECCTESWIVAGAFDTEEEILNYKSYIFTKIVRFLLLQTVVSQDVLRNKFCFIPDLGDYKQEYSDEILRERWEISDEEWDYIDSRIHNYGG